MMSTRSLLAGFVVVLLVAAGFTSFLFLPQSHPAPGEIVQLTQAAVVQVSNPGASTVQIPAQPTTTWSGWRQAGESFYQFAFLDRKFVMDFQYPTSWDAISPDFVLSTSVQTDCEQPNVRGYGFSAVGGFLYMETDPLAEVPNGNFLCVKLLVITDSPILLDAYEKRLGSNGDPNVIIKLTTTTRPPS